MMKLKKLISLTLASASLAALTLPTASASINYMDIGSENYTYLIENCQEFDDHGYYSKNYGYLPYKVYYDPETCFATLVQSQNDVLCYSIPYDENAEKAIELLNEIPDLTVDLKEGKNGFAALSIKFPDQDHTRNFKTAAKATKILRNTTAIITWSGGIGQVSPYNILTKFDKLTYNFIDLPALGISYDSEKFIEYIESLDIDYSMDLSTDYPFVRDPEKPVITLVPNGETTIQERFDLMKQIYDDLGYMPIAGVTPCEAVSSISTFANINITTNLYGDANCDGKVTIADSTAVLQAIGNEDKYGLSAQGSFNADVYGDFDGITGEDAIKLQMYHAKLIDSLE